MKEQYYWGKDLETGRVVKQPFEEPRSDTGRYEITEGREDKLHIYSENGGTQYVLRFAEPIPVGEKHISEISLGEDDLTYITKGRPEKFRNGDISGFDMDRLMEVIEKN